MQKIILIAILLSLPFTQAIADSDESRSSDGSVPLPVTTTGMQIDRAYIGSGPESLNSVAGLVTEPLGSAELARIEKLPGLTTQAEPEAVLGLDTRFLIDPFNFPASAVVLVTVGAARCSGWLIGEDTVVTAGHCVHTGNSTTTSGTWYPVENYTIYPGYKGGSDPTPYGSCTAKRLYSTAGWVENGDRNYDYGAIKLNCTVGLATGWFGYANFATVDKFPSIINGYPGETVLAQWVSADVVRKSDEHRIYYKNDTSAGMSGAPVWYDGGSGTWAFGIHTYQEVGFNQGTRITSAVFNNLKTWKNAD